MKIIVALLLGLVAFRCHAQVAATRPDSDDVVSATRSFFKAAIPANTNFFTVIRPSQLHSRSVQSAGDSARLIWLRMSASRTPDNSALDSNRARAGSSLSRFQPVAFSDVLKHTADDNVADLTAGVAADDRDHPFQWALTPTVAA